MWKPETVDDYWKWLHQEFNIDNSTKHEKYYNTVMNSVERQFYNSCFWKELLSKWEAIDQEYFATTGFNLFFDKLKQVYIKPYESMVDKTFRKNVVVNKNWPEKPEDGWIYPNEPFELLNDLLRTTIIVKYLDGGEFILRKIEELANKCGYKFRYDYEAKDKGYYAIHAYVRPQFEIENVNWDTRKVYIWIEIQITTQIQDTIKKLTHEYYEKRRSRIDDKKLARQWDYKSDEFSLNYLGHILHYLEGMIMEIRDKDRGNND